MVSKPEAKERVEKLKKLIDKYRYSRLVWDKELVEESVEDALKKELFDLEQQWPDLVTPDSPSQRAGYKPLEKFAKVKHQERMLSFNDAFDEKDMQEWLERVKRLDPRAAEEGFYCELKIDGLAIELIYENGLFKTGSTRGDGVVGEDITQNLKTIEAIPLKLETRNSKLKTIVVRGEVFVPQKEFARINKERGEQEIALYANPRNLAAGSVRQLDPAVMASRRLDSFAYSLVSDLGQKTHEEEHEILKKLGFKTNLHNKYCRTLQEVQDFRDYWEKHRGKLAYEIDGIVVIINDNKMFKKLGVVGKAFRSAMAYKFSPKESTTKVKEIIVSVGRTGTLTPVAVLEPVEIGGTTVSRATLHNEDEIERLGIKIGDTVVVGRAGDVIPDVKRAIPELRTGKEKKFVFPAKCPACRESIERSEGEAAHKCTNPDCPAIKREALYHFVSKGGMDIDGVGPKIIDQLMDVGLIKDAADLFKLTKEDLLNLERFAEKSAENAVASIQGRKEIQLSRFIYALGIPHVGEETAFTLAKRFRIFDAFADTSAAELQTVPDIGPVVSDSISSWFSHSYNKKLLEKFKKYLKILLEKGESQKLAGKTFVLTGTMESLSRDEAKEKIRDLGGEVSASVSKNTDFLVAASEPGSKYDKAKKLGVKVLDESEFLKMLE